MNPIRFAIKNAAACAGFTAILVTFASEISAQTLYKVVGADGKVTFTDRPPTPDKTTKVTNARTGQSLTELPTVGGINVASLPIAIRESIARFPVTIYTSENCQSCESARAALSARGIPFTERSVKTTEDLDAFKRLTNGDTTFPLITIGGQRLKGYSPTDTDSTLDLAGYPKSSVLPSDFKNAPPLSMATPAPRAAASAPAAPSPAAGAPTPTAGASSIRF